MFIAYAPADKPKLAVAVVVPEGGYGGRAAAPIARKIFDAYDEYIGLTGAPRKPAGSPVTQTEEQGSVGGGGDVEQDATRDDETPDAANGEAE